MGEGGWGVGRRGVGVDIVEGLGVGGCFLKWRGTDRGGVE